MTARPSERLRRWGGLGAVCALAACSAGCFEMAMRTMAGFHDAGEKLSADQGDLVGKRLVATRDVRVARLARYPDEPGASSPWALWFETDWPAGTVAKVTEARVLTSLMDQTRVLFVAAREGEAASPADGMGPVRYVLFWRGKSAASLIQSGPTPLWMPERLEATRPATTRPRLSRWPSEDLGWAVVGKDGTTQPVVRRARADQPR